MGESSPEEIAHVLAEQIAAVREAKARLVKAMHIEREGARDRAKAETDIKAAHLVIAQLLRGRAPARAGDRMSESSPEEIAHVLAEQIAAVREAKARLVKAMHIEREGARDRAKAETDIKAAHLVIAQLLRGSIGDEFIDVFRSIKR